MRFLILLLLVVSALSCNPKREEASTADSGVKSPSESSSPGPSKTEPRSDGTDIIAPRAKVDTSQQVNLPKLALGLGVTCAWTSSQSHCWGIGAAEHAEHIVGAKQVIVDDTDGCALREGVVRCWTTKPNNPIPDVPSFEDVLQFSRDGLTLVVLREGGRLSVNRGEHLPLEGSNVDVVDYLWKGAYGADYCLYHESGSLQCWDHKTPSSPFNGISISQVAKDPKSRSSCVAFGSGGMRCADNPLGLEDGPLLEFPAFTQLKVDDDRACMVLEDGHVGCWNIPSPYFAVREAENFHILDGFEGVRSIDLGRPNLCATLNDGRILCEGSNRDGELGFIPEYDVYMAPQTVAGLDDVKELAIDSSHGCGLRNDSSVWCWGDGYGDGTGEAVEVITEVVDFMFPCARKPDTSLWCWGDKEDRSVPTLRIESDVQEFKAARSGRGGCALSTHGEYQCWGVRTFEAAPSGWVAFSPINWTEEVRDEEDQLVAPRFRKKELQIEEFVVGNIEACVLTKAKKLYCCDRDEEESTYPCHQLPHDKVERAVIDSGKGCVLTPSKELWCWNLPRRFVDDTPYELEVQRDVAEILLGPQQICVRYKSGKVDCGGEKGLEPLKGINDAVQVALGDYSCLVHKTGQVSCWGQLEEHLPEYAEPTLVEGLEEIVQVAVADESACALTADGHVKCWGRLGYGGFAFQNPIGPVELPWRDFLDEPAKTP